MQLTSLPHAAHRNHGCRIRDFVWQGFRCLSLENESLRVVICADKGCDIVELIHKPSDTELLYQSPWGLGSPHDRHMAAAGGPFRDRFAGGWFLMLPNGPEPCEHHGASFGHHGEASQLAWRAVVTDDRPERIEVAFDVRLRRLPLTVERRVSLESGGHALIIHETLHNTRGEAVDVLWGHHPCLGEPFLEDGCVIVLPDGGEITVAGPVDDFTQITGFAEGRVRVRNPRLGLEFNLDWEKELFPVMGLWRVWDAGDGYPNYRGRRIVAVEPAVDFPSLSAAAGRGTALKLAPGETRSTTITAGVSTYPANG